jgi:uncharacterized protein (TIGR02118 family)
VLKRMTLLVRRDDLDRAAFSAYWRTHHAAIARAMPGVRQYVQNHVVASRGAAHPCPLACDGIVELWFDDLEAMARAFASEAGRALPADERRFLSGITILTIEEGVARHDARSASRVFVVAGDLHGPRAAMGWLARRPDGAAMGADTVTHAAGRAGLRQAVVTPSHLAAFPVADRAAARDELERPWAQAAFAGAEAAGVPMFMAAVEAVRVV